MINVICGDENVIIEWPSKNIRYSLKGQKLRSDIDEPLRYEIDSLCFDIANKLKTLDEMLKQ